MNAQGRGGWLSSIELSRRGFLGVAGGVSAAAVLAACSPGGGSGGEKVVPFFTTEGDPQSLAFYKGVISTFEKNNPGVKIQLTAYTDENVLQYLQTAFSTGADVGVFSPPPSWITEWAGRGYLLPIDDLVKSIGEDDFVPGTRVVVDGSDYAMPFQSNASALYYRKDLLDAAGIAPSTTYDDYLGAVQEMNGRDGMIGIASIAGGSPQALLQFFTPYVHQTGWSYFGKDGSVQFGRPEVLEAFTRYIAIMQNASPGMYSAAFPEIVTAYSSGKAAFATFPGRLGVNLFDTSPQIAENTGVIGIPAGPFETAKLHFGAPLHYSIYSKTKYPDEALAFLEALTTGQAALDFAMTVPGLLIPPRISTGDELRGLIDSGATPYLEKHGDWVRTFLDLSPAAASPSLQMGAVENKKVDKVSNPAPWGSEIWTSPPIDGQMVQQVLINKVDPEQAWTEAVSRIEGIRESWLADNPDWKPTS